MRHVNDCKRTQPNTEQNFYYIAVLILSVSIFPFYILACASSSGPLWPKTSNPKTVALPPLWHVSIFSSFFSTDQSKKMLEFDTSSAFFVPLYLQSRLVMGGNRAWLVDLEHDGWNYCGKQMWRWSQRLGHIKKSQALHGSHNSCNMFSACIETLHLLNCKTSGSVVCGFQILHQLWYHRVETTTVWC